MEDRLQFGTPTPEIAPTERPGAYAIAIYENRALVVATPAGFYLPGGGTHPQESTEATLRREVREETGYDVVTAVSIGTARQFVGSGINKIETFFLVSVEGDLAQHESDHLPFWIPIDDAILAMAEEAQAWALLRARDVSAEA
jgi:8-oxo-dGTP pyrophosphatase MutT (NUDIX family)